MISPCYFVIFGATGDLAVSKLLPALYYLSREGRLPENLAFLGVSRRDWNNKQWQAFMHEKLPQRLGKEYNDDDFHVFVNRFSYTQVIHDHPEHYANLKTGVG